MISVKDLKVKLFADGADKASLLEPVRLPESFAVSSQPCPSYSPPLQAPQTQSFPAWHTALTVYLRYPRTPALQSSVFCEDVHFVAVYDKYPKVEQHKHTHACITHG